MKRLFPDRVFDRPEDVEIIQLHLRDEKQVDVNYLKTLHLPCYRGNSAVFGQFPAIPSMSS